MASKTESLNLIQLITENRLRHASGPVHLFHSLHKCCALSKIFIKYTKLLKLYTCHANSLANTYANFIEKSFVLIHLSNFSSDHSTSEFRNKIAHLEKELASRDLDLIKTRMCVTGMAEIDSEQKEVIRCSNHLNTKHLNTKQYGFPVFKR